MAFALAYDEATETSVAPFYWNQINADRYRIAEMAALRDGVEPPPPDARVVRFSSAGMRDADVFRGMLETILCLATPQQVMARPDIAAKVAELGTDDVFRMPGTTIELPVMGTFEVRDGKIAAWRDYFDLNQFMSQMSG